MQNVRRWYVYLTSAVSLHVVTWALIALLRGLFASAQIGADDRFLALQIAILVIGLPLFLGHWLWAQRLAAEQAEERRALLRRIYLYGNLAGFFAPLLANAFSMFVGLLNGEAARDQSPFTFAIAVLAVLFAYHRRVLDADLPQAPEMGRRALVRRVYVLGFSAAGLWMTAAGAVALLRWLFGEMGGQLVLSDEEAIYHEIVRLALGLVVWVYYWRWAEALFASPDLEERDSALRKFYLYLAVFISTLSTVGAATAVLAGLSRRWLGLPPSGDGGEALPMIVSMGGVWAYHAFVLRRDADAAPGVPRQAAVRRLYLYLVAAVGLGAFLVGLVGDVNVLIAFLTEPAGFGEALRAQLAWSTAALIAGLPVWLLPWRAAQSAAADEHAQAADHRHSLVRKIYLYAYLFVATMTALASLVNVAYQLILLALGERAPSGLLADLAQPFSYTLIAGAVLAYHGMILRQDGRIDRAEQRDKLEAFNLVILDGGEGRLGQALVEALAAEYPALNVTPLGLTSAAAQAMGIQHAPEQVPSIIAQADLVIGPWDVVAAKEGVPVQMTEAVLASPARKLLVPTREAGWDWVAVEAQELNALAEQTVKAVGQILAGEEIRPGRSLGAGTILAVVVGVILSLVFLSALISYLFEL